MTRRLVRTGHCYRCIYTWRLRRRVPAMCPRCKSTLWNVPKIRPLKLGNGLGIDEVLGPHRGEILRLAREHGARSLRVFGSVRRREADEQSDVDLLVDWGEHVSLLDVARFRVAARNVLGRRVDTVEERLLDWSVQPQILAEAVPL
ncbi:MAG: nucleotidyltransferase domain-containing protein [Thermoplasmata archaeon]